MYHNNQNPYRNTDPFGPKKDWGNDNSNQKKLQQEREENESLALAEFAIDNIVKTMEDAKNNDIEISISASDKAKVVRHFSKYWNNKASKWFITIFVLTVVLSFFSVYASLGILGAFIVHLVYSHLAYMRVLLNVHDNVSEKEVMTIKKLIFGFEFTKKTLAIITVILMVISAVAFVYSINLFIDPSIHFIKQNQLLSKISSFDITNELFAIVNGVSIIILMMIKTFEKWWK